MAAEAGADAAAVAAMRAHWERLEADAAAADAAERERVKRLAAEVKEFNRLRLEEMSAAERVERCAGGCRCMRRRVGRILSRCHPLVCTDASSRTGRPATQRVQCRRRANLNHHDRPCAAFARELDLRILQEALAREAAEEAADQAAREAKRREVGARGGARGRRSICAAPAGCWLHPQREWCSGRSQCWLLGCLPA